MKENLEFLQDSAYLITDVFNRRYYSGINCDEGYVLVFPNKCYYFADARYFYALKQKVKDKKVIPLLYKTHQDIKAVLQK